jgi:hypothetical protein
LYSRKDHQAQAGEVTVKAAFMDVVPSTENKHEMPQKIHYRDDIYMLSVLVRTLEISVSVDADPDFFKERVIGDVFFVDATLRSFADLLTQNRHLVSRSEYLKLLGRVSADFCRSMEKLQNGESPTAASFDAYLPQLRSLIAGQKAISQGLYSMLKEAEHTGSGDTELVSEDELERLLGD